MTFHFTPPSGEQVFACLVGWQIGKALADGVYQILVAVAKGIYNKTEN
jgi:hypothetical protein